MISRPALAWATVLPIAAITVIPVAVLATSLLNPDQEIWRHLLQFVLPELLANTVWLVLGVGLGVTLLGVSLAWLTAACEFPGRAFFNWALLLPLALPAYITAFVWIGLFDFTGVVQVWLRDAWSIDWRFPIRSRGGVILVMILALYPYVYLTARAAFLGQGGRMLEAAQTLGISRTKAFFRVALPIAYPGIMAGVLLALMETLADFGAVSVFNYNTFTTAIYKTWYSLFSLQTASQLATLLALFVFALVLAETHIRRARSRVNAARESGRMPRMPLAGWRCWLAAGWCMLVFLLAFALPVAQLAFWAAQVFASDFDERYIGFAMHSLLLSGMGALLVVILAVALGYAQRLWPARGLRMMAKLAILGYALPGAVLAVGFFIPVAWLDNRLIEVLASLDVERSQVLGGTLLVMLLAYCARFLAVGFGPVEAGLARISLAMDEVAQSLGITGRERLRRVHLPMLRVSLLTAAALAFVDIMKELPITLMTRPFGWDTLAIRVFEMTSEGEWLRASLPAIVIVLAGLLPVFFLIRNADHAHT